MDSPRDSEQAARAWRALHAVRKARPLVHNITNYVAMDVSANMLLAAGASPAMIHAVEEAAEFTAISAALVVNIGTLSPPWVEAMKLAMQRAKELGIPVVLDPVGAGATAYRTDVARALVELGPAVVRGNASEIMALAGATGIGTTKGVDSSHSTDESAEAAAKLAQFFGGVVAVTGAIDRVTDGKDTTIVYGGHPMMAAVTALGCAASAVIAAFLSVCDTPMQAATYALSVYGLAGELAAAEAPGPGSLRWRLIDALYNLDEDAVQTRAHIVKP